MKPVVNPNEEVQLDFAGPLSDELNKDEYILVAIDRWSKYPTAKVVSNTTTDVAIKLCKDTSNILQYEQQKTTLRSGRGSWGNRGGREKDSNIKK